MESDYVNKVKNKNNIVIIYSTRILINSLSHNYFNIKNNMVCLPTHLYLTHWLVVRLRVFEF